MLLARLKRQAVCLSAVHVAGLADHAPGNRSLVLVLARQESRVRAAVAKRDSEALRHAKSIRQWPWQRIPLIPRSAVVGRQTKSNIWTERKTEQMRDTDEDHNSTGNSANMTLD